MPDEEEKLEPTPGSVVEPGPETDQIAVSSPAVEPVDLPEQVGPVLPASTTVQYVQEDGTAIRAIVLRVASDGNLKLFLASESGRMEVGGVAHDANKAVGTWHEAGE